MSNQSLYPFFRALVLLLAIALLAASCSPQRYPQRRAAHPRGCDCPTFK